MEFSSLIKLQNISILVLLINSLLFSQSKEDSHLSDCCDLVELRTKPENRNYISQSLERELSIIRNSIVDEKIACIFTNAYPNTIDNAVDFYYKNDKPFTYIITGDIDAMWLRDAVTSIWPYIKFAREDENIRNLVKGLINSQKECIQKDPYANAFYKDENRKTYHKNVTQSGIHERKWEVDGLCYFIRLSNEYYKVTNDTSVFDSEWKETIELIVKTFKNEQHKNGEYNYKYVDNCSLVHYRGVGRPIRVNGLITSMFRPSDDYTIYPYNIPSNFFAAESLKQLAFIYQNILCEYKYGDYLLSFSNEIFESLNENAVFKHKKFGKIYAYEIDGYGNAVFMDDANVPSLLSLPYLCTNYNNGVYNNTRKFILSRDNPYYFDNGIFSGIGSPHTGLNKIWPIAVAMQGLTSNSEEEIKKCLSILKNSDAQKGVMHESFNMDNPKEYTRDWFCWANSLFSEFIIEIYFKRKYLLTSTD
jgi:meiotically up-regulated gene 157 (Mug157) protein